MPRQVDHEHNIYLTYAQYANSSMATDRHCLIRWDPDGGNGVFVDRGGEALCSGKPHGLKLANEGGALYLYHANVQQTAAVARTGKLTKTTLDGGIVWQVSDSCRVRNAQRYYYSTILAPLCLVRPCGGGGWVGRGRAVGQQAVPLAAASRPLGERDVRPRSEGCL